MAMNDLTGQLRAVLWWLVPLVLIAVVIGWETGWGKGFTPHLPPPESVAPKPVVVSLLPDYTISGGAAAHTEMVQRTLFNPTRRPAPAAADAAAGRMQRGQFALTGTLVIDGKSTAYLKEVQGNKSRRVLAGDKVNGMLVAEVKPDRVRLTLGDESEELLLKVATNPRPTVQPAAAAPVVAGAVPAAATPGTPPGAAPAPPAAAAVQADPTQTLAERRRAARAAALDQTQQQQPPANQAASPAAPAANPSGIDPRWNQRSNPRATQQ
jgi:hypothetical protein